MLDYLRIIEAETASFAEALRSVPDDTPVPTCPGWTALDLLWHLASVQGFWARVLSVSARTDEEAHEAELAGPPRPASRGEVAALQLQHAHDLLDVLATSDPQDPAWSWFTPDQTVGFVLRRQAHEALVHRVDAELTAATGPLPLPRTTIDPALAADGVAELITHCWGVPPGAEFTPIPGALALVATDTGDRWCVRVGTMTEATDGGKDLVEPTAVIVADTTCAATVSGTAAEMDLWLWGRGPAPALSGDQALLAGLTAVIAHGV